MGDGSSGGGVGAILVVEDERPLRETIQWILEDEGFSVQPAANGRVALELAERAEPRLVVLDMALPILNGDAVAVGLRRMYGTRVPILLTTADGRAAEKAVRVGAYAYLQKPFDIDALVNAVIQGLELGDGA
jgi:DNA-binding response OmpR family regulator